MATQADVADHLDLSQQAVAKLVSAGVLPKAEGRGSLDIEACRVAYIRRLREQAAGRSSEGADEEGLDLVAERARLAKEQADAQAMKNAEARGELVRAGPMTDAILGIIEVSKSRLAKVGAAVAKTDAGLRVKIDAAIEDALEDLSMTRVQEAAGGGEDEEADADTEEA
jgi:phage terminase Nu1 subunit (DNA packaging protein)